MPGGASIVAVGDALAALAANAAGGFDARLGGDAFTAAP